MARGPHDAIIQALKHRVARKGPSAKAESRAIPAVGLRLKTGTFAGAAARMRSRTSPQVSESADIVRLDRDRDHLEAEA